MLNFGIMCMKPCLMWQFAFKEKKNYKKKAKKKIFVAIQWKVAVLI